jgi:signal recognition particle subunit SRP19
MKHTTLLVYPVYVDAKLKRSEGRKISKSDGLPNPNPQCMVRAASLLGFQAVFEAQKRHPRNFWVFGRIAVTFFTEDHAPVNPAIADRLSLYKAIAAKMKELGNVSATPQAVPKTGKLVGSEKSKAKRDAARRK